MFGAYEACHLSKDTRKRMDALDHGAKAVRQVDVLVPGVSECCPSFQE